MIISMRPHATREEIDHVRERIAEFGYRVHSIEGEERVVIGVVGVGDVTACLESLEATPGVERAVRISAPYKFVSKEFKKGRSAITALANSVIAINTLADWDRGTTLNVGVINGGSAANVVADSAVAELDVRFWENDEDTRVHRALTALCENGFLKGVTTTLTRVNHKPAMAASEATQALMQQVEKAGKEEGIDITWQAVGGGSDANHTAALGIPTLDGFGPIGAGFHSPAEWLDKASIEPRIRLLKRVVSML